MKLILARHGQTDWNSHQMVQGRTDIPLNETGKRQAAALGERLKNAGISAIYSGPLSRAYDTGCEMARSNGCGVTKCDKLTEIKFGVWEGMEFFAIAAGYPALWKQWCDRPDECQIEGAETLDTIAERTMQALERIIKQHSPDDTVAIASHTMPIKLIVAHYTGIPFGSIHRIRIDNCGYTELNVEDMNMGKLIVLNDVSHLSCRGLI
ncbi:MAG: histidine phosphatase family protein [Clostridia bacterium]